MMNLCSHCGRIQQVFPNSGQLHISRSCRSSVFPGSPSQTCISSLNNLQIQSLQQTPMPKSTSVYWGNFCILSFPFKFSFLDIEPPSNLSRLFQREYFPPLLCFHDLWAGYHCCFYASWYCQDKVMFSFTIKVTSYDESPLRAIGNSEQDNQVNNSGMA